MTITTILLVLFVTLLVLLVVWFITSVSKSSQPHGDSLQVGSHDHQFKVGSFADVATQDTVTLFVNLTMTRSDIEAELVDQPLSIRNVLSARPNKKCDRLKLFVLVAQPSVDTFSVIGCLIQHADYLPLQHYKYLEHRYEPRVLAGGSLIVTVKPTGATQQMALVVTRVQSDAGQQQYLTFNTKVLAAVGMVTPFVMGGTTMLSRQEWLSLDKSVTFHPSTTVFTQQSMLTKGLTTITEVMSSSSGTLSGLVVARP